MKLEILCGWAHPYKTIAKSIEHSIDSLRAKLKFLASLLSQGGCLRLALLETQKTDFLASWPRISTMKSATDNKI